MFLPLTYGPLVSFHLNVTVRRFANLVVPLTLQSECDSYMPTLLGAELEACSVCSGITQTQVLYFRYERVFFQRAAQERPIMILEKK